MSSYMSIPTWENGEWTHTEFEDKEAFADFLQSIFKEPGEYEFDETVKEFTAQAIKYKEKGYYCSAPKLSRDFLRYWDFEKEKSRKGAIYKANNKTWYLTRDFYFWINFLPIFHKDKNKYLFPDLYDTQYHMALYEHLAEANGLHAAIVKKRQIASSYFHCAKLLNQYWFEEGARCIIGASLKAFIEGKGSWKMFDEYSAWLNSKTAWIRHHNPGGVGFWEQKIVEEKDNAETAKGTLATLKAVSFEKKADSGVGGACRYFFHEEAGIAPLLDITMEFAIPAMKHGMLSTGQFIAAGSVGELQHAEPLRQMILRPQNHDVFGVPTKWVSDKDQVKVCGLFIPEQYSMEPFIDKYGNSEPERALAAIKDVRAGWKKQFTPKKYQYRLSQRPTTIKEAFDFRDEALFPSHLVAMQEAKIMDHEYPCEYLDLHRDQGNNIVVKTSSRRPIDEFPINPNLEDKTACVQVWERPDKASKFGDYYISIDPVGEGKTTTSESLCAIYVYKRSREITSRHEGSWTTAIEQGKIVAAWCGRYDDIRQTHSLLEMIIDWYQGWTVVENNINSFIQYMISKKKQKFLVPKDQMLFMRDINNSSSYNEYGWRNSGTLFGHNMVNYGVEFCSEEIDQEFDDDGLVTGITYGISRIPDKMLLEEMKTYQHGVNADRIIAFVALVAFAAVQESNRGLLKRVEKEAPKLQDSTNFFKLDRNPFNNIARKPSSTRKRRSPFKRLGKR